MVLETHSSIPHSSFNGMTAYVRISGNPNMSRASRKHKPRASLTHVSLSGLASALQQLVDHRVEVHQTCVFPQIVVRLDQERVILAVLANKDDFLGSLQRWHDIDLIAKLCR
jgi:hypothetical protein